MNEYKKRLNEECGIMGVYNSEQAAELTLQGLHQLQHRGQDASGIVTYSEQDFYAVKGLGLVSRVFEKGLGEDLYGSMAIGHVRYATSGKNDIKNAQPLISKLREDGENQFAYAHNGHIENAEFLKVQLKKIGVEFQTDSDSEILEHLIHEGKFDSFEGNLINALNQLKGAFVYIIINDGKLFIARDPNGFRPVSIAVLRDSYIISSETCVFDRMGAKFIHELKPGELISIDSSGMKKQFYSPNSNLSVCSMEFIYFSKPESIIGGVNVYNARKLMGNFLSQQCSVDADIVIGVPDSGIPAAIGFSLNSKIPFEQAIIKNKYVGRTFIEPTQILRENSVLAKFSIVKEAVADKKIIVVDDSIVRGTTIKQLVYLLRRAGAKEVHVRIASPSFKYACSRGIDIPTTDNLIASKKTNEEICSFIGADSLIYLEGKNLIKSITISGPPPINLGLCVACQRKSEGSS